MVRSGRVGMSFILLMLSKKFFRHRIQPVRFSSMTLSVKRVKLDRTSQVTGDLAEAVLNLKTISDNETTLSVSALLQPISYRLCPLLGQAPGRGNCDSSGINDYFAVISLSTHLSKEGLTWKSH